MADHSIQKDARTLVHAHAGARAVSLMQQVGARSVHITGITAESALGLAAAVQQASAQALLHAEQAAASRVHTVWA